MRGAITLAAMLRFGVIGTARIGDAFVPAIRAAGHEVVAVASRDASRARECATRWDVARVVESYEALLHEPGLDAVYIPLPNSLHAEWTLRAIDAGKHVVCEKPLALTIEDVDRVIEAARTKNVVVTEAFAYRAHPLVTRVRELVHDGAIGTPQLIRGNFTFTLNRENDVRFDPLLGGGALWDVGCYCVSYARTVLGEEPIEVRGTQRLSATGIDLSFEGTLRFASGATAEFHCAFDAPFNTRTEIIGSTGSIVIGNPFKPHLRSAGDARVMLIDDFARAIVTGTHPAVTLDDSRANTAALVALYASAR